MKPIMFVCIRVCLYSTVYDVCCLLCVCGGGGFREPLIFSAHCVCVLALGHPGGRDEAKEQRS